ncbi:MAG: hypothetical protein ACPGXZ_06010 [Saprospiraceae bacterium]
MNKLLSLICCILLMATGAMAQNTNPIDLSEYKDCRTVLPPKFYNTTKVVEVKAAWTEFRCVPAQYSTVTEEIEIAPAHHREAWINGVKCLIPVAPEFKTITKTVVSVPAQVVEINHPALYETINKKVLIVDGKWSSKCD